VKISPKPTPEVDRKREQKAAPKTAREAKISQNRKIRDTVKISAAAKTGTISRDQAVKLMSRISYRSFHPLDNEGEPIFLPYIEKSRLTEERKNPITRKLLGKEKVINQAVCKRIGFIEALDRLEKGKKVVFKPFCSVIKNSFHYSWGDGDEVEDAEIRDFNGLKNFTRGMSAPEVGAIPDPKIILETLEQPHLICDGKRRTVFSIYRMEKGEKKHISSNEAFKQLKNNEESPNGSAVFFFPYFTDSIEDCCGGWMDKLDVEPVKVKNFRELQEFYRLTK